MELEIKAPITVNAYDRTFVEAALNEMRAMFAETRESQRALDAKLDSLMASEDVVRRLTDQARSNRERLQGLGDALQGATADPETPQTGESA